MNRYIVFLAGFSTCLWVLIGLAKYNQNSNEVEKFICTDTSCENRNRTIPDVEVIPNMYKKSNERYKNV